MILSMQNDYVLRIAQKSKQEFDFEFSITYVIASLRVHSVIKNSVSLI